MDCRTALLTLLDQVDYTAGNCKANDPVGGVLPVSIIKLCREAALTPAAPDLAGDGFHQVFSEEEKSSTNKVGQYSHQAGELDQLGC